MSKQKRLSIVFAKRRSQSANEQSRVNAGDSSRHTTRVGAEPFKSLLLRQKSTSFDLSNFFIHCESNGISSRRSRGYHHRRCISSAVGCIFFRNDDIQGFRLGDIQNFVLMIYTPFGVIWTRRLKPKQKVAKLSFFIATSQQNRTFVYQIKVRFFVFLGVFEAKLR